MKFGKLRTIQNVDFSLPPDPAANTRIFQELKNKPGKSRLFIGATGWGMKEWVGKYYPAGTKPQDYLAHYAQQFNTIELNTTHYRIPDELTIERWREQSTEDFRFCSKVPQRISHSRDLSPEGPVNLTRQFCDAVAGLREKLGPCFIQLPPYFGADRLPVLRAFLENWNKGGLPLAVEARHESWFDKPQNFEQLAELLEQFSASTVITDVAGRRDVCHMRLTTGTVLVRFVGNALHPTDFSRIEDWSKRLRSWFENGLKNAYFFTHEPDNILSPELASFLHEKMEGTDNLEVRGPTALPQAETGRQMTLF